MVEIGGARARGGGERGSSSGGCAWGGWTPPKGEYEKRTFTEDVVCRGRQMEEKSSPASNEGETAKARSYGLTAGL